MAPKKAGSGQVLKRRILFLVCLLALETVSVPAPARNSRPINGHVPINGPVPSLVLPDIAGQKHPLTEWRGKPFVLFFFCGCRPCHDCARLWAQAQQAGELRQKQSGKGTDAKAPATVIVFLGDGVEAKQFQTETSLVPAETRLLTDLSDQSGQRYGVTLCPRVFVVNAGGRLSYSNFQEDGPQLSAAVLVSRTLTAWHRLSDPALPPTLNRVIHP